MNKKLIIFPPVQDDQGYSWEFWIEYSKDDQRELYVPPNTQYVLVIKEPIKIGGFYFPIQSQLIYWQHFDFNIKLIPEKIRHRADKYLKLALFS